MRPILIFSDAHIPAGSSLGTKFRLEDPLEAILRKLRWIAARAKELDAEGVFSTGDLLDKFYGWTPELRRKVCQEALFDFASPLYTIYGNHELPGKQLAERAWSDLTTLAASEIEGVRIMPIGVPVDLPSFTVVGYHWNQERWRTDDHIRLLGDKLKVAVIHAPLGPKKTDYCEGVGDIDVPGYDVAVFGDIHDGFPITRTPSGCLAANPGSLLRKTIADAYRAPQIVVVWPDKRVEYEVVPHTPPEEAFNLGLRNEEKERRELGLKAAKAYIAAGSKIDPVQIVLEVGKEAGFTREATALLAEKTKKALK